MLRSSRTHESKPSTEGDEVVLVFEACRNDANITDIQDGVIKRGVQIVTLREKLTCGIYDRCAVRRLKNFARTPETLKALEDFRNEVHGRPYEKDDLQKYKVIHCANCSHYFRHGMTAYWASKRKDIVDLTQAGTRKI